MGSAFTPSKTNPIASEGKNSKVMYVLKNTSITPIKRNENLKMISVHPNFINIIRGPIIRHPPIPRKHGCVIKDLDTKDDNT